MATDDDKNKLSTDGATDMSEILAKEKLSIPLTTEREREEIKPPKTKTPMDVNMYATKKSIAQGMMDIALLTSNASQLKMVLQNGGSGPLRILTIVCICISLGLQVLVGVLLIINARYNINKTSHQDRADRMNNITVVGIFLITIVNVLASSFSEAP